MRSRSTPVNESSLRRQLCLSDQRLGGESGKQTRSFCGAPRTMTILPERITAKKIRLLKICSGQIFRNNYTRPHLPAPDLCGWFVEPAGPCHQVFHTPRRKQRTSGLKAVYSDVLRISNDASFSKLRCLLRFCAQADRTDSSYRCKSTAALLDAFGFVEVCDTLLGYDMTHIVAVDHDRCDRHPCLFPNFNRIEGFDEGGHVALFECLHSLNQELSSSGGRTEVCLMIEPCRASEAATRAFMSHIRCATEAGNSNCSNAR